MRIQHNIPALSAYRNYTRNVSMVNKNLEKLSSGYKINRAGDDAAGLAISEKMRIQISGLEQAQNNAKAGINLVQTAEGALTEVHDMLNRMYTLAEQSANGTYADDVDREQLQKEIVSLRNEINRIADATNYNGIKLLDGSLEDGKSKVITGAEIEGAAQISQDKKDPGDIDNVGTGTILRKAASGAKKTVIQAEMHNVTPELVKGDKVKLTVGGKDIELTVVAEDATPGAGEVKASEISTPEDLAAKFVEAFNAGADKKIGGQDFTAEVVNNGDNPAIKFTQVADPTGAADTVDAGVAVTVTCTQGAGVTAAVAGTAATGVILNWADVSVSDAADVTATEITGITGLTTSAGYTGADKVAAYINANHVKVDAGTDNLDIDIKSDGGALCLYVGNTKVGVAVNADGDQIDQENIADGATVTFNFKALSGADVVADSDLGSLSLTASGRQVNAGAFAAATATGSGITPGADSNTFKEVDFSGADTDKLKALAVAAGAESGEIVLKKKDADNIALYVGDKEIASVAYTATANFQDGADTPANVLTAAFQGTGVGIGDIPADGVKTGLKFTAAAAAGSVKGTYNAASTMNVQGAAAGSDQLASTKFKLDGNIVKDGQTLTIGQKIYTFAVGSKSTVDTTGTDVIDLTAYEATDTNKLIDAAGRALSQKSNENGEFSIGYNSTDDNIYVHEKKNQSVYDTELESVEEFQKLIHANKAGTNLNGKELTLQIGDTADDYNKIGVSIKDMHDVGMGIATIDISDQDGASKAMDAIKKATNYVSDVRGDLGALQNRLDHTINNLSVTQENITDAESTIRDVDIAKEMMAYTKNNILVQSAQAMLAQANQLPQGVLQLLG